jgi:hypothetical protein
MNKYIAQKEVPDLIINGVVLDTLSEFDLFIKNGHIDMTASMVVISKELKRKLTNNLLVGTTVVIEEALRDYDGNDSISESSFVIKDYEFSYALDSDGEPTHYNLVLRNYYNG